MAKSVSLSYKTGHGSGRRSVLLTHRLERASGYEADGDPKDELPVTATAHARKQSDIVSRRMQRSRS